MLSANDTTPDGTKGWQYIDRGATTVLHTAQGGSQDTLHGLGPQQFIINSQAMLRWRCTDPGSRSASRFTRNMVSDNEA